MFALCVVSPVLTRVHASSLLVLPIFFGSIIFLFCKVFGAFPVALIFGSGFCFLVSLQLPLFKFFPTQIIVKALSNSSVQKLARLQEPKSLLLLGLGHIRSVSFEVSIYQRSCYART